jgi:outer membrane protein OmpA-like peptidoglycan-associated protein
MKNRCLLGAGVALAVAFSGVQARAQWFGGGPGFFYFGGEGGWTSLPSQTATFSGGPGVAPPATTVHGFSASVHSNSGYNVGARLGYEWGPWRFEEEFSYRNNGFSEAILPNVLITPATAQGTRTSYAIMTNVIYDFTFGWPITPHIGGGIGAVDQRVGASITTSPIAPLLTGTVVSNNQWSFGYQAIAGIRYSITPFLDLDLDYRYLGSSGPTFNLANNPRYLGLAGTTVKSGTYTSNNLVASLTVKFGPPPPPPPVVPPPAPPAPPPPPAPKVFLVFFDWDRYNITPAGMQIVHRAADAWHAGAPVIIKVNGYTDLSGSPGYNIRLSIRRANAVANALTRFGVPRSEMDVHGYGESNPRVPTAKGVREPQNRRVEIIF